VLDLGCGSAEILSHLGNVSYIGIDLNAAKIARARAEHGHRGHFLAGDFACLRADSAGKFDLVLCIGLLHHLDDQRVRELAALAYAYLSPSGRLIGVDPVFVEGQHWIARRLAAMDSGRHVRTAAAYQALIAPTFANCKTHIEHDLARVPYSHCITIAWR
jgi:SAM-dependent methyltransferase